MDMEVVRLVVGVLYGPQLGAAGPDNGIDARHLHLLPIDLAAVELERSARGHVIECNCGTRRQPVRKGWPVLERVRCAELEQIKMIIARRHHW
jgi:hypothetical protein